MKTGLGLLVAVGLGAWAAYHALMFYDNDFRYGRMRETPAVRPHEEPLILREPGGVPVTGGEPVLRATPAESLQQPLDPRDQRVLERGRAVYSIFCAQCHGLNYDGNGAVGQSFTPLPTDLRDEEVQSKPAGELFQTVSYGIPGGRQPPLDTTITAADRWSVIAYIKSLGPNP